MKPLIISVGLLLTVSVFRYKHRLIMVFEGWGILGTILLVVMVAIIPFGLCRGLGLSAIKGFFLTFALFYILAWVKFPGVYYALGDSNLGFINLGFLILFIVAIFKLVKPSKFRIGGPRNPLSAPAYASEIDTETESESGEISLLRGPIARLTKTELSTLEGISEALNEIEKLVETHQNALPVHERERISTLLGQISKKDRIFLRGIENSKRLLERIRRQDIRDVSAQAQREKNVTGDEKRVVKAQIGDEDEKLGIENTFLELEGHTKRYLVSFNTAITAAGERIRQSPYAYDAKPFLARARELLSQLTEFVRQTRQLEEKLLGLCKTEKKLLRREKRIG